MSDTPKSNVKYRSRYYNEYELAWFISELTFKYPLLFMVYRTGIVSLGYKHESPLHILLQKPCD